MIETAIQLTGGKISGADVQHVIDLAKAMLTSKVELLDYAEETVTRLAQDYPLMIITKGDLLDQESKIGALRPGPAFQVRRDRQR